MAPKFLKGVTGEKLQANEWAPEGNEAKEDLNFGKSSGPRRTSWQDKAKVKLLLLLALLFGAVSALHLRTETSKFESPLGDETLPQDGEMPEHEAMEAPVEGLMLPEEEEEGCSGSEDAPEEEEAVKSASALGEVYEDFQCPKEEETVKLVGIPGYKTSCFLVVSTPMMYNQAQHTCQTKYWGNLISIHDIHFNYCIWHSVKDINQGQVWIGGSIAGSGHSRQFYWMDGSAWNFWYWAPRQPSTHTGNCVSLDTHGGYWSLNQCNRLLPFICSY
ncbi:PREDICTED: bone marrow proteoglycan-like [Ceratotherium simum simum]|uniref:Bone marrow proteoglycan-like n=1 Tax=Ceratotherium simum simum TaxID=73337 RepID=A0ABM1D9V7_CERSS|nr:PREDICTED: bone marrow proteoglycan-like [Ceratotherium simum simum]